MNFMVEIVLFEAIRAKYMPEGKLLKSILVLSVVRSNRPAAEQIVIFSMEDELVNEILSVAGFG